MSAPIRRKPLPTIVIVILVVGLMLARWWGGQSAQDNAPAGSGGPASQAPGDLDSLPAPEEGEYEVVRVIDGDTIKVRPLATEGGSREESRVRLLGIDTPETVKEDTPVQAWGPEASEFTKEFLAGGRVRLQFDRRKYDQYERMLAYVFVGDRMLNEELARAGLARVHSYEGDAQTMANRLERAQEEARREGRGIWSGR